MEKSSQCNLLSNCIWRHLYGKKDQKTHGSAATKWMHHPSLTGYEQEKNRSVCNSYPSRFSLHLPHPWSNSAKGHLIAIEFHQHNSDKMIPEGTRGHARGGGSHVLKCLRYFWTKAGSHPTISLNKSNKHLTGERSRQCSWNSLLLHVMICTGAFAPRKIQAIANRFCIKNQLLLRELWMIS